MRSFEIIIIIVIIIVHYDIHCFVMLISRLFLF